MTLKQEIPAVKSFISTFACAVFVLCAAPVSASYKLSSLLPGDAVDTYTDLTAYSFSVPFPLKKFGASVAPRYAHTAPDKHSGGIDTFAYLQLSNLRLGIASLAAPGSDTATFINGKFMASYLFSFISIGIEAGAMRSASDSPVDRWGSMGAVTSSVYFNRWAFDAAARFFMPNASAAAPNPLPSSASAPIYQNSAYDSQLYSLRLRNDLSFRWRMTLAGNFLYSSYSSFYSLTNLWRYRLENMQIISGLSYRRNNLTQAAAGAFDGDDQVNIPVYAILEHARSIFYIGVSSPVYRLNRGGAAAGRSYVLRFEPQVAYTHRFTPGLWLNFSLGSQSVMAADNGTIASEVRVAFQLAYNIAPFGADDEVAFSGNLLTAAR